MQNFEVQATHNQGPRKGRQEIDQPSVSVDALTDETRVFPAECGAGEKLSSFGDAGLKLLAKFEEKNQVAIKESVADNAGARIKSCAAGGPPVKMLSKLTCAGGISEHDTLAMSDQKQNKAGFAARRSQSASRLISWRGVSNGSLKIKKNAASAFQGSVPRAPPAEIRKATPQSREELQRRQAELERAMRTAAGDRLYDDAAAFQAEVRCFVEWIRERLGRFLSHCNTGVNHCNTRPRSASFFIFLLSIFITNQIIWCCFLSRFFPQFSLRDFHFFFQIALSA
jgi:hypothetical protein